MELVGFCGVFAVVGGFWGGLVVGGLYLMFKGWLWGGGGVGEGMGTSHFSCVRNCFFGKGCFA